MESALSHLKWDAVDRRNNAWNARVSVLPPKTWMNTLQRLQKVRSMICIGQTLAREEWVEKNKAYPEQLLKKQVELKEKGIVHKNGSMRET